MKPIFFGTVGDNTRIKALGKHNEKQNCVLKFLLNIMPQGKHQWTNTGQHWSNDPVLPQWTHKVVCWATFWTNDVCQTHQLWQQRVPLLLERRVSLKTNRMHRRHHQHRDQRHWRCRHYFHQSEYCVDCCSVLPTPRVQNLIRPGHLNDDYWTLSEQW